MHHKKLTLPQQKPDETQTASTTHVEYEPQLPVVGHAEFVSLFKKMLAALNAYVANNPNTIKKNKSGRRDNVIQIATAIYEAVGVEITEGHISDLLTAVKPLPVLPELKSNLSFLDFSFGCNKVTEVFTHHYSKGWSSELEKKFKPLLQEGATLMLQGGLNLTDLPKEILLLIFSSLPPQTLVSLSATATIFRPVVNQDRLWQPHVERDFPKYKPEPNRQNASVAYKELYKQKRLRSDGKKETAMRRLLINEFNMSTPKLREAIKEFGTFKKAYTAQINAPRIFLYLPEDRSGAFGIQLKAFIENYINEFTSIDNILNPLRYCLCTWTIYFNQKQAAIEYYYSDKHIDSAFLVEISMEEDLFKTLSKQSDYTTILKSLVSISYLSGSTIESRSIVLDDDTHAVKAESQGVLRHSQ